jgi:hypothetical protein
MIRKDDTKVNWRLAFPVDKVTAAEDRGNLPGMEAWWIQQHAGVPSPSEVTKASGERPLEAIRGGAVHHCCSHTTSNALQLASLHRR